MNTHTEAKISLIEEIQNKLYDLKGCLKSLESEINSSREAFQYCFCVCALKSVEEAEDFVEKLENQIQEDEGRRKKQ